MVRSCLALAAAALACGCTDGTYVIGAVCGALGSCPAGGAAGDAGSGGVASGAGGVGGAGTGGTSAGQGGFFLDLTGSGVERLPSTLFGREPTHLLVSSDVEVSTWPARVGDGFDVSVPAALSRGEPWPFADAGSALSHAGAVTFSAESPWAELGDGALALEAVFRGEPGTRLLSQRDASAGLELALDAQGRLTLALSSGASSLEVSSPPLVADAWHHCLTLVDLVEGAQIICNGQAGDAVTVPSGLVLEDVMAPATLGDGAAGRLRWAELASWQAASFGPRGAWADAARERFSRLVGSYAEGAKAPLPFAEMRASGAYLDMTAAEAPELRRLHPVGEHWPRIVCRPTVDAPRTCGLLVESSSSRQLPAASFTLDKWDQAELSVTPGTTLGPRGDASLFALTPSAAAGAHSLSFDITFADGPAVLSVFARAAGSRLLRLDVLGVASATFDLTTATVTDSSGTRVAGAEPWGDGLLRLSYSFDVAPGPGVLQLSVLASDGSAAFAGNGDVAAEVGEAELRFRSFSTPLPAYAAIQPADLLVFPSGNGNFPNQGVFSIDAEFWLPEAPLVTDVALVNASFAGQYEQQINLFVTGAQQTVRFGSLLGAGAPWTVTSKAVVTDGRLHRVVAAVDAGEATLSVDDVTTRAAAEPYDTSLLDRISIGASKNSSGPLTGIVRRVRIAEP